MSRFAPNSIEKPNPFGRVAEDDLMRFEYEIGADLPSQYREYLLQYNGAEFAKASFHADGAGANLHHVYGLHDGPQYFSLRDRWDLAKWYDIGDRAAGVSDFLVFASCGTGEPLLLHLKTGAVYSLDPDAIQDDPERGARFEPVLVADSFDAFIQDLMSDEEYCAATMTPEEVEAFKRQLAELGRRAENEQ
ncbi:SMI1/KNR4 family protein [Tabrizicola sp.]|uniref:SMI1/KNR4 family protein n=1 Tax=Tabrizicola sp. TaxID=2005166 RepID=UPI003F335A8B